MKKLKIRTKIILSVLATMFLLSCFAFVFPVSYDVSATTVNYVDNHTIGEHVLTIVDETTDLNKTLTSSTTETYNPIDRTWGGISSVISAGDNVFVAWRTGGQREPSPFVYVVVGISTDGGKTFREPYLIIDPPEEDGFVDIPMFYYNHAGELWLTYRIFGCNRSAEWAIKIVNPDGAIDNIKYEEPIHVYAIRLRQINSVVISGPQLMV